MEKVILIDGQEFDAETGELINEVEQVEVEVIEDILPAIVCNGGTHIQTNTEQLKKELVNHLAKYDVEVTQETEKEASKMATELNKLAKDLNTKRLAVGKEIKKPADALKKSIDELIDIVQNKRTDIINQVNVFKEKRFTIIRFKLEEYRDKLFKDLEVSEKYQFLDIESLVIEGSLGKSELTKKAKESVESMVRRIKALEDAVRIRTLQLKITCLDAGLEYPIELHEVESFIKEDDYDSRLKVMIDARLLVEKQVKEKAEAEAGRRKQEQIEAQEREITRVQKEKDDAIQRVKDEAIAKENARLAELAKKEEEELERQRIEAEEVARLEREKYEHEQASNKRIVTLDAVFNVEVPLSVDSEKVYTKFKKQLEEMFAQTFESLTVR